MKFLKLSLAASVALGALSTASFAQPLEEAIKGVDVSGYLRYRYNDDRYDYGNDTVGGNATHRWKTEVNFKTPVVNNVALNLGILYNNEAQNVNHGKGVTSTSTTVNPNGTVTQTTSTTPFLGTGLGAGQDSDFGVSQFYATITPDNTATTVMIGKQLLGTPVTMAADGDRGTGILALNSDLPGLTLAAGAFDSWMLDDLNANLNSLNLGLGTEFSVDKPLYALAAIYGVDTGLGNIGAQVWGFAVDDVVDTLIFSELSWKHSIFNAKAQYLFSTLSDSDTGVYAALHGLYNNSANVATDNDLYSLQVGANFSEWNLPLDVKLGYIGNTSDGTKVSFDDEGAIAKAGKIWWQNSGTGVSFGIGKTLTGGTAFVPAGQEEELSVFYGALGYGFIDNRLQIGIEGVSGEVEKTQTATATTASSTVWKKTFTEITPTISWQHSKNLKISAFYAMLTTEDDLPVAAGATATPDEDRNRARVEVKYSF